MVGTPRQLFTDARQFVARRNAPLVLELDLTTDPVEGVPADPVTVAVSRRRATLREIVDGLRRAAEDDRARVVVAHLAACGMPLARVQEIRAAIERFRESGGVAYAYADTFGEFGGGTIPYYLACAFDEIWLAPPGDLGLTGVAMETPFLRDALDRLGVTVEIGQRYEYKNAVNTLVERDFTPAHLEALGRIVESCADQIVAAIAAGRGLSEEQVRRLIDLAPLAGHAAFSAGLVDRIGYRDEVYDHARERARALAGGTPGTPAGGGGGSGAGERETGDDEATVEPVLMYVSAYRRAAVRREESPVRRAGTFASAWPASVFLREARPDHDGQGHGHGALARRHDGHDGHDHGGHDHAEPDQGGTGSGGDETGSGGSAVPPSLDPRRSVVALIHGTGPVMLGSGALPFSGPVFSADAVAAAFRSAARDPSVAAAVFRVDSPGGSYVASDVVRREVERFRATGRPVIVSMGAVAASGGYFVALAADRIVANPGTLTGSIGVFGGKQVVRDLLAKVGIGFGAVAAGENALMMSPRRPFSQAERAKLDEFLDRVYADFVDKVAKARGMSHTDAHELARGRVWTGADAHRNGLVDELGGLSHAVDLAWARAGLPAGEAPRVRITPKPSVLDRLRTPRSSEDQAAAAALGAGGAALAGAALAGAGVGLAGAGLAGAGGLTGSGFAGGWGALAPLAARAGLPAAGPLLMPPVGQIR